MPDTDYCNAGDMRFRVEIQANTPTLGAKGQKLDSWSTVATRWAAITPASGQHFVASEQIRNATSHKIVMRYFDGLTPRHRLKPGARYFNVLSVIDEGSLKVRHTVLATEVI